MRKRRIYADTNVIIRYLTNDPVEQADKVELFLSKLTDHNTELYLCDLVIAEAVYVLQSFYRRPRGETAERLHAFCVLPGIAVEHWRTIKRALDLFAEHKIDFTDAYLVAAAETTNTAEIFTFDKDFAIFETPRPVVDLQEE